MMGVVTDSWSYVWAAYGITWAFGVFYVGSLLYRAREVR
jgi:hypothetical protein